MELDGVSAKLPGGGRDMVKDFSYEFQKRDRVGIVGANGVGKSSFLNLISGRLSTTEGEIKQGETLVLGYYEQQVPSLLLGWFVQGGGDVLGHNEELMYSLVLMHSFVCILYASTQRKTKELMHSLVLQGLADPPSKAAHVLKH